MSVCRYKIFCSISIPVWQKYLLFDFSAVYRPALITTGADPEFSEGGSESEVDLEGRYYNPSIVSLK